MRTENSLFGKRDSFTRGKDFNYCRCSRLGELSSFRLMRHAFGASPQPSRKNEHTTAKARLFSPGDSDGAKLLEQPYSGFGSGSYGVSWSNVHSSPF